MVATILYFFVTSALVSQTGSWSPRGSKRSFAPPWTNFIAAKSNTWDEVFGRPLPKGKQLATEQRKLTTAV